MRICNLSFALLFAVTLVASCGCESQDEVRRKRAANNLKQLKQALDAYHEQHGNDQREFTGGRADGPVEVGGGR